MRTTFPALTLLLLAAAQAHAIKVSGFEDLATFISRSKDILIVKCVGPADGGRENIDGLNPMSVHVITALKGAKKVGPATVATIYPMKPGKTYLVTSMGGSAYGTDLLAVPQLAVVEVPPNFPLADLKGKKLADQLKAVCAVRLKEIGRLRLKADEEKKLLGKAVK